MAAAAHGRCPDARFEELAARHGLDSGAYAYLEELRWPDGVSCVRCSSHRVGFLTTRQKHQCRECGYQFRVTAGTVLHDSHVPPAKWLRAVQLMLGADEGFPANRLHAVIGGSYKSSWFLEHRIRAAMGQALLRAELAQPVALAASGSLRRTPGGAYRRPSLEYLGAYWAELRWRAAHAGTEEVFRMTMRALLEADPVRYRQLTGHPRPAGGRLRET